MYYEVCGSIIFCVLRDLGRCRFEKVSETLHFHYELRTTYLRLGGQTEGAQIGSGLDFASILGERHSRQGPCEAKDDVMKLYEYINMCLHSCVHMGT